MPKPSPNRSGPAKRLITTVVKLSARPYSIRELATLHNVTIKTVRRDIAAIEELSIPLYRTEACLDLQPEGLYAVDKHWMQQFLA